MQPLPLSILKHEHSSLKVIELFPQEDPEAFDKFLEMTDNTDYNDYFVVLRNAWGSVENTWKLLNSSDALREHADLTQKYNYAEWYLNSMRKWKNDNFSVILDDFEGGFPMKAMQFDYRFLRQQEHLFSEYRKLWEDVHPGLGERMLSELDKGNTRHHFFMSYGNKYKTPLHGEPLVNYMLQVQHSKRWRMIHKKYTPYVGVMLSKAPGILATPLYYADQYPGNMPYTELTLNPGDLMYFPSWHYHEVINVEDNQFSLSVGLRPPAAFHTWREKFRPLAWYEWAWIPFAIIQRIGDAKKEVNTFPKDPECPFGATDIQQGFNGTVFIRFDHTKINGKCEFIPRVPNYQELETTGKLGHLELSSML